MTRIQERDPRSMTTSEIVEEINELLAALVASGDRGIRYE
jgi:hypothetical protein